MYPKAYLAWMGVSIAIAIACVLVTLSLQLPLMMLFLLIIPAIQPRRMAEIETDCPWCEKSFIATSRGAYIPDDDN